MRGLKCKKIDRFANRSLYKPWVQSRYGQRPRLFLLYQRTSLKLCTGTMPDLHQIRVVCIYIFS
jgi:hypothetical protein